MTSSYDAVADVYVAGQPDSYDEAKDRALFALVGPVDGARVLDVACGHGRVARELARRGTLVVGVDVSVAMLDHARRAEAADPLGVGYVEGWSSTRPPSPEPPAEWAATTAEFDPVPTILAVRATRP